MFDARSHYRSLIVLLLIVSLLFFYIVKPFVFAVLWAMILAILFYPLHKRILKLISKRQNLAALATLLLIIAIVILPMVWIGVTLFKEVSSLYLALQMKHINFELELTKFVASMPSFVKETLNYYDLGNFQAMQEHALGLLNDGSQEITQRLLSLGQNTFSTAVSGAIMLYLLFFLLRDGESLSLAIMNAVPLDAQHKSDLLEKFTTVVKATVKGNIVVAIVQGILGGIIFAILGVKGVIFWSVLMACLSLVPAVGSGLVWFPVAIYFMLTGMLLKGIVLIAYGLLVIGLVDNVLRPILVGKDTKLPDYLVLISTLGGLGLFGISGFVLGPLVAALFVASWTLYADLQKQ